MDVAITGGSGRLGTYVVDYFTGSHNVTVVDLEPPKQQNVRFVEASILDYKALKQVFRSHEAVVHLAAIPNPRTAPPDVTFNTNVQGTWNVLEAAENVGVRRVAIASSDASTGLHYNHEGWGPQYLPVDEAHPQRPVDFYSLSKEVTEVIGRSYANRGELQVVVLRPSRIVYPQHWPELEAWAANPQNHHLWGYVEPDDVARAFLLALAKDDVRYDVFFICASDSVCLRPTLEMLKERLGELPEIRNPVPYEQNPMASVFDNTRARKILGFEPKSDWKRLFAKVPLADRIRPIC